MPARPVSFSCHIEGVKEIQHWLRKVPLGLKSKVLKGAVREAIKPGHRLARSRAPVRFGFMRRSMGTKVKGYKSGNVVGLYGPRSNYVVPDPRGGQTKSGKAKTIRPSAYAHLVERTKPFLGPAAEATADMAVSIMVAKVKAFVEAA